MTQIKSPQGVTYTTGYGGSATSIYSNNTEVLKGIQEAQFSALSVFIEAQHKETQEALQTLRGRQAVAAAISVTQLLIVIAYLVVSGLMYVIKCVKEKQAIQLEENLLQMENRLQERKTKRRSAAKPSPMMQ